MVVEAVRRSADHRRKSVQRAGRRDQTQMFAVSAAVDQCVARFIQTPAGRSERADGIGAVQRGVDGELPGHVRAQAQRTEQIHRMVEIAAGQRIAAEHRPAHAPAAGAMHFR